jgi:hypothetical protein
MTLKAGAFFSDYASHSLWLVPVGFGAALAVMCGPLMTTSGAQPVRLGMTVVVDEVSQAMPQDKAQRTPTEQKLDSHIVAVIHASRDANSAAETLSRLPDAASLEINRHGQVHVDIQGTVTGGLLSAIGSLGGTIESTFANYGTIRAWIPLAAAETLASREDVRFIAPAAKGTTNSPDGH